MAFDDIDPVSQTYRKSDEVPVEQKDGYDLEVSAAPELLGNDADVEVLQITKDDAEAIHESVRKMTTVRCRAIIKNLYKIHEPDPNFPTALLRIMEQYISEDFEHLPAEERERLDHEMKVEAVLATENSPYPEVRAVVDTDSDYDSPTLTFRVWVIGIIFVAAGAFINQLFSIRQPAISVGSNVAQLLAFPFGKALELILPDKGFVWKGERYSLNPGKFSRKEHMLITIMANVGFVTPYTANIILTQFLPQYFNQKYAQGFSYQILIGLGTNFVGYGMAGITRRFLVYPASCVWPTSLVTIALNKSFHADKNSPVSGPLGRIYRWSRMKLFFVAFCAMFVYYWLPGFLFPALSTFNWISWIAPDNVSLNNIVGSNNGLGLNPIATFDWNIVTGILDPLVYPFFSTMNYLMGYALGFIVIVGMYWTNAYNTAYLPINSNHVYDNTGVLYNVTMVTNSEGIFNATGYESYSPAFMAAGNLANYFFFFAAYAATVSYSFLFHRHEIVAGIRQAWKSFRNKKTASPDQEDDLVMDIHQRIQSRYPEVSEWYYLATLLIAAGIGMAGIGAYKTYTNPAVVLFGILLCLMFVVPIGLITAITGIEVTLNVLAEFIGGAWVKGNALSMNYFKAFGYITCAQAIAFASDLKLAHYTHIPPWHTFAVQMVGTLISTFVCTGVFNYQLHIENVCTPLAKFKFTCPGINTFFTAAVFWGTLGPEKIFGAHGQYKLLLVGFPVGFVLPFILFFARKRFPKAGWLRQIHPVVILNGALNYAPYNLSYFLPSIPFAVICWRYLRVKYLAFWAKYNYVLAAALPSGIAIASIIIFFALEYNGSITFEWWGTDVPYLGCEGTACRRLEIPDQGYFGPAPGTW